MLNFLNNLGLLILNRRFWRNFWPIPAKSKLALGSTPPDFGLTDITNNKTIKLSSYQDDQPVILAFTRIFTEKHYCPLCKPHIAELNQNYETLKSKGIELLMITSIDAEQCQKAIADLDLKIPLLSDPSCEVFKTYRVGQALGAPLPGQFVLDREGKLQYKHLFSFLSPNASTEKLLSILEPAS